MIQGWLRGVIRRDLRALKREVLAYPTDADLWATPPGVSNSGGNLALHVAGNLRHFVGDALGGSGYVRDRDSEFARRNQGRREVAAELDAAEAEVADALAALPDDRLREPFPGDPGGTRVMTGDFLAHLAVHLGYHLGQVDYHRRLVCADGTTVAAVAIVELVTAEPAVGGA